MPKQTLDIEINGVEHEHEIGVSILTICERLAYGPIDRDISIKMGSITATIKVENAKMES